MCPCHKEGYWYPGMHRQNIASSSREGILPLCSPLLRPHQECWAPQCKRDMGRMEWVQWGATKGGGTLQEMLEGLEHLCCGERLRELGWLSLEQSRLWGMESMPVNTSREGAKRMEPGSSQWCLVTGPETTGTNWTTGGSLWTPWNGFSVWGWHRHRLPHEVMESPSLELFGGCLDMVLGNWLWMFLLEQAGLNKMTSRGPLQPEPCCAFMILYWFLWSRIPLWKYMNFSMIPALCCKYYWFCFSRIFSDLNMGNVLSRD